MRISGRHLVFGRRYFATVSPIRQTPSLKPLELELQRPLIRREIADAPFLNGARKHPAALGESDGVRAIIPGADSFGPDERERSSGRGQVV